MSIADEFHLTDSRCPPDCEEQTVDEVCGLMVCPIHNGENELVECVESKIRLHHNECRDSCPDCRAVTDYDSWEEWMR